MATRSAVVSDASPLIALERVGRLDLLREVFGTIVVPPAVAFEVFGSDPPPAWIEVRHLRSTPSAGVTLGRGEQEAIALAQELDAGWIVLDDLPARRWAARFDLRVIGTVGVLLAAKRRGLLDSIGPLLDALEATEFRLAPNVRLAALAAAGESEHGY